MPDQRRGFVLIIVLALLGILAFLAVNLVERSLIASRLGQTHMDKVRSRLMARSGVELGFTLAADQDRMGTHERVLGGTRVAGGDGFRISVQDASAAVNLNDGLEAAFLERGDHLADNAMECHEEEQILPEGSAFSVGRRRYTTMGFTDIFPQPGDRAIIKPSGGGAVLDETEVNWAGSFSYFASSTSMFIGEAILMDHMLPGVTSGNYSIKVVRDKPLGLFNLRLRHILNAYGDAHRFIAQLGLPTWRKTDWDSAVIGSYGVGFTPTSTALGKVGLPTPALDSVGMPINDPSMVATQSTGLGDRIIAARPAGGYKRVDEVEDVVRSWASAHLPPTHIDSFVARVTQDFTVDSPMDPSFSRMRKEFGYRRVPRGRDFKMVGYAKGIDIPIYDVMATANQYRLKSMPGGIFDFSDLFAPHPVAPINLNAASLGLKAAVFWAPLNVGYVAESVRTAFDTRPPYAASSIGPHHYASNPERFLGVSEPVFTQGRRENGVDVGATAGKFMSLRDALVTAQAHENYLETMGEFRTFDGFREFLRWRRLNAAEYEKVQASTVPYNPHRIDGGHFTQDYAEATLPHVFSCLRRIPGYLGAPQALLSTYKELDPLVWRSTVPYGSSVSAIADWNVLRFHAGSHPVVKVEDFVSRETLPKVSFESGGTYLISSLGTIHAPEGPVGRHQIDTVLSVFKRVFWRSQSDFSALTDPTTHASINVGPEILGFGVEANKHLGVVGLKDSPDAPSGIPNLQHDFTQSLVSQVGPNPVTLNPLLNDDSTFNWMSTHSTSATSSNFFQRPNSFWSSLEDGGKPMLSSGSDGCDLSPFNGVSLLSINHGLNSMAPYKMSAAPAHSQATDPVWIFTDALYWRPAGGPPMTPLLDPAQPTGRSAGVGSMSLWFRVPSGDRFPGDESDFLPTTPPTLPTQPVRSRTRGCFHTLAALNLWEKSDFWWNVVLNGQQIGSASGRAITLQLGYVFDTTLKRGRIIGRYESRNRWDWMGASAKHDENIPFPGFFDPTSGYTPWPGVNADYTQNNDLMGLYNPVYGSWENWRSFNKVQVARTEIVLKDLPECGPGSWHRVSLGWDTRYQAGEPLKLVLHDTSNLESQTGVTYQEDVNDGAGEEPVYMMPWDTNMTLSLGETHARSRLTPTLHPFHSGESTEVNGDYEWSFRRYSKWRYLPAWRLDSLLDNFRLYLGSQGDMTPSATRHDVSMEPRWVLNPSARLPAGARIIGLGARVFEPTDSDQNHPHLQLSLENAGVVTPIQTHDLDRSLGRVTERSLVYNPVLAQDSKIVATYKNSRPNGNALVNNGITDNWSEIPWILEVSVRYSMGSPRIVSWAAR